jgi:hypothetical protein
MIDPSAIRERFSAVGRGLNERTRRLFAAIEARTAGYGGIAAAAQATGLAPSTIGRGLKDLDDPASLTGVVRRPGSGRRALTETDTTLLEDLGRLLEPAIKGDPMRPLRWVSKSHAKLAAALRAMGHQVSKSTIPKLLEMLQYRRQVNRKTLESSRNPDRDAQFEHINATVIATQAAGQPVISIDTKKKELIGPYKNPGSDYRPNGCPDQVKVHDFVDDELGKVVPYPMFDISVVPPGAKSLILLMWGRDFHKNVGTDISIMLRHLCLPIADSHGVGGRDKVRRGHVPAHRPRRRRPRRQA